MTVLPQRLHSCKEQVKYLLYLEHASNNGTNRFQDATEFHQVLAYRLDGICLI